MEITEGEYKIKFIEAENSWETYYNDKCIAKTTQEIWDKFITSSNDGILKFNSKEAGQELLFTAIELTSSIVTSLQKESSMIKDDDGHVVNELEPSDKIGEPLNEKGQIVFEIAKTLEDLKSLPKDCSPGVIEACNSYVSKLIFKYAQIEKTAYQKEFDTLKEIVASDLQNNLDCSQELERMETIAKILNDFS